MTGLKAARLKVEWSVWSHPAIVVVVVVVMERQTFARTRIMQRPWLLPFLVSLSLVAEGGVLGFYSDLL